MSKETPQFEISKREQIKLLHQDLGYRGLVGAWMRATESPQRPEIRQWIRERRALYLTDPNPQNLLKKSNRSS